MDVSTQTNARQELSHNHYDLLMENKNQRAVDYYKITHNLSINYKRVLNPLRKLLQHLSEVLKMKGSHDFSEMYYPVLLYKDKYFWKIKSLFLIFSWLSNLYPRVFKMSIWGLIHVGPLVHCTCGARTAARAAQQPK